MIKLVKYSLMALLITLTSVSQSWAENSAIEYSEIQPAFVVNYGGPGRLKYLKVQVTMVTSSPLATETAQHHIPLVRNELVSLFSSQTDEAVSSPVGQDQLRQEATKTVKELFQKEVGHPVIEDLLFLNFIYQK